MSIQLQLIEQCCDLNANSGIDSSRIINLGILTVLGRFGKQQKNLDTERWLRVMSSVIYGHQTRPSRRKDRKNMLAIMISMEIKFP